MRDLWKACEAFDDLAGTQSWVVDAEGTPQQGTPAIELASSDLHEGRLAIDGHQLLATRLHTSRGESRWMLSLLDAASDRDPEQLAVLQRATAMALSDASAVRRDLDEMRNMFQLVLDTIPVRVFWKDRDCVYLGGNRLFAGDAGLGGPEELPGKTDFQLGWPNQAQLYVDDDRAVMESGVAKVDYEEPQTHPGGILAWLQTSKIPLRDTNGNTIGVLGTYADITPRKQAEAERERLLEDLENKNAELERFAYTVSHDLKSPLVTIQGFLGVLDEDIAALGNVASEVASEMGDSVSRIRRAADKMRGLLDELLEMSRIGRILQPKIQTSFGTIMADALLSCNAAIEEAGAEIDIRGDEHELYVDAPRVVQVIQNLVENACKYRSPERPLRILIELDAEGSLRFEDNGIGIPEQHRERVFRVFEKLDPTTPGSGIGLALVKRIIETHGGSIRIEGAEPGTAFVFYLPTNGADSR